MLLKSSSSTVKIVHIIASNKAFKTVVFVQTTWQMKEGLVLFWCRVKVRTRAFSLKRCNQRDIIGFWWRNGPRFKLFCCHCICVFVLVIQCNGLCIKDDIIVETDDPTYQSAKQRPATSSGLLLVLVTVFFCIITHFIQKPLLQLAIELNLMTFIFKKNPVKLSAFKYIFC